MPAEPQKELYFLDRAEHAVDDACRDDQQNPEAVRRESLMSETRPIQMPTLMKRRMPADAAAAPSGLFLSAPSG